MSNEKILAVCEEGTILKSEYTRMQDKIVLMCKNGHIREQTIKHLIYTKTGSECKECKKLPKKEKINPITKILEACEEGTKFIGEYLNSKTNIMLECKNGHIRSHRPDHLVHTGAGKVCRECTPRTFLKKATFDHELEVYNLASVGSYVNAKTRMDVKCPEGHSYSLLPEHFTARGTGSICRVCHPLLSQGEQDLRAFIESIYTCDIIYNDRTILLDNKELDVVLPDLGIAIEYNGTYWHSTAKGKTKNYHLNKTEQVEAIDFQLIHISEYDWSFKQKIVKSRLGALLGKSTKLYARKCTIKEISHPKDFLESNHLQGAGVPARHNFGLYYLEELMAVMTFGLSRFNNNYEYEMYRFCSKLDTTVVGGAAKLLKYFKDKYAPNSICSYAARSWSRGDLYDKLGFSLLYKTEPSYSYHRRTEKVSRYQAQKHKLAGLLGTSFDPSLTEEENMAKVQFYRVYDSGNLLYGWISGNKRIDTITN